MTDAFWAAFGQNPTAFEEEFEAWQCEQAARNEGRGSRHCGGGEAADGEDATTVISGIVTGADGAAAPWVRVLACDGRHAACVDLAAEAEDLTDAEGRFELAVSPGSHRLAIELGEGCTYYSATGDEPFKVDGEGTRRIEIRVPGDACDAVIEGRVQVEPAGSARLVSVSARGRGIRNGAVEGASGRWLISVPAGQAEFMFALIREPAAGGGVCSFAYAPGFADGREYEVVGDGGRAPIYLDVPGWDISEIEITVRVEGCVWRGRPE